MRLSLLWSLWQSIGTTTRWSMSWNTSIYPTRHSVAISTFCRHNRWWSSIEVESRILNNQFLALIVWSWDRKKFLHHRSCWHNHTYRILKSPNPCRKDLLQSLRIWQYICKFSQLELLAEHIAIIEDSLTSSLKRTTVLSFWNLSSKNPENVPNLDFSWKSHKLLQVHFSLDFPLAENHRFSKHVSSSIEKKS